MNSTEKIECSKCKGKFEKTRYRIKTVLTAKEGLSFYKAEKHILCCPICGVNLKNTSIICPHCKSEFEVDKIIRREEKKRTNIFRTYVAIGIILAGALYFLSKEIGVVPVVLGAIILLTPNAKRKSFCPVCERRLESA